MSSKDLDKRDSMEPENPESEGNTENLEEGATPISDIVDDSSETEEDTVDAGDGEGSSDEQQKVWEQFKQDLNSGYEEPKYETNDDWKFEAEAPTLNDEIEIGEGNFVVDAPQEPKKEQNEQQTNNNSGDIVIKRGMFKVAGYVVIGIIIAAVLVFLGIWYYTVPNSDERMNPGNVVLTVEGEQVSVGMYNYYYDYIWSNYETYASYGYYDLDSTQSYETQYTTNDDGEQITWLQRFQDDTIYQIKYLVSYYHAGVEHGITLTEEEEESIEEQLTSIEEAAADEEQSVNDYINEHYAKYCGEETIRKILTMNYIGQRYYYEANIDFAPTAEEAEKYAEENASDYQTCEFAFLELMFDPEDENSREEAVEKAKDYCEKITTLDDLLGYVAEASAEVIDEYVAYGYYEDAESAAEAFREQSVTTDTKSDISSMLGDEIADWLFSADTKIGELNYCLDEEYGYAYVFMKTAEPAFDETEVYSVRHILVIPGEDADEDETENEDTAEEDEENTEEKEEYSKEEWETAREKAQSILDEYNAGDKTEVAFAKLAEEFSDDTESTSSGSSGLYGGLYEGTELGAMVSEFEDWAVNESREYGDTGIVESEYGCHIMFFVFDGPQYVYDASTDLRSGNISEFINNSSIKISNTSLNKADKATPTVEEATTSGDYDDTDVETYTDSENDE